MRFLQRLLGAVFVLAVGLIAVIAYFGSPERNPFAIGVIVFGLLVLFGGLSLATILSGVGRPEDAAARSATFGLLLGFERARRQRLQLIGTRGPVLTQNLKTLWRRRFRQHVHSDGADHRPGEAKSPCHDRAAPLSGE